MLPHWAPKKQYVPTGRPQVFGPKKVSPQVCGAVQSLLFTQAAHVPLEPQKLL